MTDGLPGFNHLIPPLFYPFFLNRDREHDLVFLSSFPLFFHRFRTVGGVARGASPGPFFGGAVGPWPDPLLSFFPIPCSMRWTPLSFLSFLCPPFFWISRRWTSSLYRSGFGPPNSWRASSMQFRRPPPLSLSYSSFFFFLPPFLL